MNEDVTQRLKKEIEDGTIKFHEGIHTLYTKNGRNTTYMEETKYLYVYGRYSDDGVYRYPVTRETDANIWVKTRSDEIKISKKTYRTGSGYYMTNYYEENPELLEKWKYTSLKTKYQLHLQKLQKCFDVETMKKVLTIPIVLEEK